MSELSLRSPAKINLFLHVHSRYPDGYHKISTLIQAVSLFDTISLKKSKADQFACSDSSLENSENLVVLARDLFRRKTGICHPVSIRLIKSIPAQAGLGGGSGNAATTLFGMNQLFGWPLSEIELMSLGAELGSDVPFFFSKGTAICRGRGDLVDNISPSRALELTLYKPEVSLKTPDVYRAVDLPNTSHNHSQAALDSYLNGEFPFENNLEEAAFSIKPALKEFKRDLLNHHSHVLMSGSGSAFFGLGSSQKFDHGMHTWRVSQINRKEGSWY